MTFIRDSLSVPLMFFTSCIPGFAAYKTSASSFGRDWKHALTYSGKKSLQLVFPSFLPPHPSLRLIEVPPPLLFPGAPRPATPALLSRCRRRLGSLDHRRAWRLRLRTEGGHRATCSATEHSTDRSGSRESKGAGATLSRTFSVSL